MLMILITAVHWGSPYDKPVLRQVHGTRDKGQAGNILKNMAGFIGVLVSLAARGLG
jgi:hypothetical protein